ncbi:hypothetical protein [Halorussus lipolyticus]|uniref:hypothetical protein n=1 Tax=Halorussus lipolyticus TaxID=3034024 RepID=UPI0023E7D468|nr:hypothetical protein [Halorussus sp. DT80]
MSSRSEQGGPAGASDSDSDGRLRSGGAKNWLLVDGNRLVVAGGVLAFALVGLFSLVWAYGFTPFRASSPMYFLFSALVTGDLTLVTVVLSINQLVLSRELGSPGTLQDRIQGALQYRGDVEEAAETGTLPKSPTRFLRFLHERVEDQTHRLDAATASLDDEAVREEARTLTSSLYDDVDLVNRTLDADDGIFSVVSATIATNHADQLQRIAALADEHADSLSAEFRDLLDTLETTLLQIDVARNYFKTVYVQKELAYLSRVLLYVGVPAIVVDGLALVFYNALGPETIPVLVVYAVVAVAFVLGFAPLAILFAFVLRLAWVAQRTATVAPFSSGRYRS